MNKKQNDKDVQTILQQLKTVRPNATNEEARHLLVHGNIKARTIGWYSPEALIDLCEDFFGTESSPRDYQKLDEIKEAYKTKILAIRNYRSDQSEFKVKDFVDIKKLLVILNEVDTCESDLTHAGQAFLEEYYGFRRVAKMILIGEDQYTYNPGDKASAERIDNYASMLQGFESLGVWKLLQKSPGNIEASTDLNEDLMPPERQHKNQS